MIESNVWQCNSIIRDLKAFVFTRNTSVTVEKLNSGSANCPNNICYWLTCTTSISAKVYCKEFSFIFKPEIVVWSIGRGIILRDQGHVQLETCVPLTHNIEDLPQTQPVFTFRDIYIKSMPVNSFIDLQMNWLTVPGKCPNPSKYCDHIRLKSVRPSVRLCITVHPPSM